MFWDDYDSITNNQYVRSWQYLPKYFSENLTAGSGILDNYWRPLLLFSFSLDYKIGGLEPFFYHLQNLVWHMAASCLFFLLLARLVRNNLAALFGALLFAAHPLQAEAVSYVAGRADPMHTALLLGSIMFFLKYSDTRKNYFFVWSLVFFAFALLTKERAIIFPAIISLITLLPTTKQHGHSLKKIVRLLTPYFIIAGIYLALRMTVLHFTDTFDLGAQDSLGIPSLWIQLLTYFKALAIYAGLLIWPAKLYMEKSITLPTSLWNWQVLAGIAIFTTTLFVIIRSWKNGRLISIGLLWFFVALSPSLHVFPIQGLLYEHWLYPAMPGLLLTLCAFLAPHFYFKMATPLKLASVCLAICIVSAFGIRTIIRNNDWQSPIRFYEKNISLGGFSARIYTNLGMAYDDAGRHKEGIEAYRKATELDGRLFQPWYDMGNTFSGLGDNESALDCYAESIKRNPYFIPSYTNSASIYFKRKDFQSALEILKQANEKSPSDIQVLYNLAIISKENGDTGAAKKYLDDILELDPRNTDVRILLNRL
jgi:tetratricopeptide (TPR) repeat protein